MRNSIAQLRLKRKYRGDADPVDWGQWVLRERGFSDEEIETMPMPIAICSDCGRLVFASPQDVAIFCGGVGYVFSGTYNGYSQYSIQWNEEGWQGGIGGGIRRSCNGDGYENF